MSRSSSHVSHASHVKLALSCRPVALLLRVAGALGLLVSLVGACGARGPLDDDAPLDAGAGLDGAVVNAADATPEIPDASLPDAKPEGGSIISCGTCLIGQCSKDILGCVQDAACRTTLQCVATDCLSGGSPDPACLFKCASGDTKGALKIFTIFTCVTSTCGPDCGSVLGGLLGGLGGGGGGGGGGGKGNP